MHNYGAYNYKYIHVCPLLYIYIAILNIYCILAASVSTHIQLEFLNAVYPPPKRFWRLAAALEQVARSIYSTPTPLPHGT